MLGNFSGHVTRREQLEYLFTTGMIEGKQSEMLYGLTKWLNVRRNALKMTRDLSCVEQKNMVADV